MDIEAEKVIVELKKIIADQSVQIAILNVMVQQSENKS